MEVTVIQNNDEKLVLLFKDASTALLNALRRFVAARLPAFAVDEVDFYENTSAVFNEFLANRIGLIPLTYEDVVSDDAKVIFSLDAEAIDVSRTVYSHEMASSDSAIKVSAEKIPLITLGKGQKLRFEATARKGTAAQHAKFQSAFAVFSDLEDFKLANKCKKCGSPIMLRDQVLAEKIPASKAPDQCLLCFDCEDQVKAKKQSGLTILIVESYNNSSPLQHLNRAITLLDASLEAFSKELKA